MSEFCNYGDLKDELLRDRLVVGIRDSGLSEKMQTDPTLTLEKAKIMIRQKAAVREQRKELEAADTTGSTLEGVTRGTYRRRINSQYQKPGGYTMKPQYSNGGTRTGQPSPLHNVQDVGMISTPACNKCNRKGHFSAKCFSKTVSLVTSTEDGRLQTAFLDMVSS